MSNRLNLSILISLGKETKWDFLISGERTGTYAWVLTSFRELCTVRLQIVRNRLKVVESTAKTMKARHKLIMHLFSFK